MEFYGGAPNVLTREDGRTWPDTLDIMGWNVDPQGLGVIFDRAIPPFVSEHIAGKSRSDRRQQRPRWEPGLNETLKDEQGTSHNRDPAALCF